MPFVVRAVAAREVRAAPEQESEQIEKKEPHRAVPSQVANTKCLCLQKARARRSRYVLAWQKHNF